MGKGSNKQFIRLASRSSEFKLRQSITYNLKSCSTSQCTAGRVLTGIAGSRGCRVSRVEMELHRWWKSRNCKFIPGGSEVEAGAASPARTALPDIA